MSNREFDALQPLLDILNQCNGLPPPTMYTGSGLNENPSTSTRTHTSSSVIDTLMRHSRQDLQLNGVFYHPDLLRLIMDTSKPQILSLLDLSPDTLKLCRVDLDYFLSTRNARRDYCANVVSSEGEVCSIWVTDFGLLAITFLNHLFWPAKIGMWRGGSNPRHLIKDDLPPDFVPSPNFTFTFCLKSELQLLFLVSSKLRPPPSGSCETGNDDSDQSGSSEVRPEIPKPSQVQLLTVEIKSSFNDPTLLPSLEELLQDKRPSEFVVSLSN